VLDGLKTWCGIERMQALPVLLCSEEAWMPLVGFKAPHVRQGMCHRGAATRQGARPLGPISPETVANQLVKLHVRALESGFKGAIRALATAGACEQTGTGIADGTELETTARSRGCGQVTRQVRIKDKQGRVHAIEVTVYGWKGLLLIEASTTMPLAVNVATSHAHEALWSRALVTQARLHRAGVARRQQVVCAQGCLAGTTRWWLDQHEGTCVVPAQAHLAVTADARAQAAAGEESTGGRRAHTVRHGQGKTARTERLETAVVGITGLTTDDQDGTPAHECQATRRDCHPHPIQAVVVRQWQGTDDGPGGNTVLLTKAPVEKPVQVFDDDEDRRLLENGWIKACKQQGDVGHPPPTTARAVPVQVVCTRLMFALATAYRRQGAREAPGGESVGWQGWRRQLSEQTREQVIVCAQGA
jgi:hypothetical protein